MRKAYTLLVIGLWVTALSYLGFPYFWKDILFTISGLGIIYFSYTLYQEAEKKKSRTTKKKNFDNFSENDFVGEKSEEDA